MGTNQPQNWRFCAAAKSVQSCPTLCDPIDNSPPGSPVPGILQARTLEWVAICFSNAWKWKVKVRSLSRVRLFAIPWTAAYQAFPSMGFSRQEYWSGMPLPSLELKINCTENNQDVCWSDHHMTNFEMTVRANCAILHVVSSLHLYKLPFKSFCPLINRGKLALGQESIFSPSCWSLE